MWIVKIKLEPEVYKSTSIVLQVGEFEETSDVSNWFGFYIVLSKNCDIFKHFSYFLSKFKFISGSNWCRSSSSDPFTHKKCFSQQIYQKSFCGLFGVSKAVV